jgi:hypothetical protein
MWIDKGTANKDPLTPDANSSSTSTSTTGKSSKNGKSKKQR